MVLAIIAICVCVFRCAYIGLKGNYNVYSFIKKKTGVDLKGCSVVTDYEDYGFQGDGCHYIAVDCSHYSQSIEKQVAGWNVLPMSEKLNKIIYGTGEYAQGLSSRYGMPKVMNGKYLFILNSPQGTSGSAYTSGEDFPFSWYVHNISVAVYDSDNKMFYYFNSTM